MINPLAANMYRAQTQFQKNVLEQQGTLYRLATGRRINAGQDDPAGLISATELDAHIAALDAESRSIERVQANANVVDGNLSQLSGMMTELRGLLVSSGNTGAMSDDELAANQLQIDSLVGSIQRFTEDAVDSLDGISLPDGNDTLVDSLRNAAASVSSLTSSGENHLASGNFEAAEEALSTAATTVAEARGLVGAYQKDTLETRGRSLAVERENLLAAHSQIMDADYAEETSNMARADVLATASAYALRVANQTAATTLSLLS
ncbi:MAG: flagellin [Phycisphaerae bacterium]|jgi:flagellin